MKFLSVGIAVFVLEACLITWAAIRPVPRHLILHESFAQAVFWLLLALALSRTILKKSRIRRSPMDFKTLVMTLSLVFACVVSYPSINIMQNKVFGPPLHTSHYQSPMAQPGVQKPAIPLPVQKAADIFFSAAAEEINSRWITITALLMLGIRGGWAVAISSLLFALLHLVYPMVLDVTESGLYRFLPTFIGGVFFGVAFIRFGLVASIAVHVLSNMTFFYSFDHSPIPKAIFFTSAFAALIVLPLMTAVKTFRRLSPV